MDSRKEQEDARQEQQRIDRASVSAAVEGFEAHLSAARQEAHRVIRAEFDSDIAEEYIEEFEHQDGYSCWYAFFSGPDGTLQKDMLIADVKVYIEATGGEQEQVQAWDRDSGWHNVTNVGTASGQQERPEFAELVARLETNIFEDDKVIDLLSLAAAELVKRDETLNCSTQNVSELSEAAQDAEADQEELNRLEQLVWFVYDTARQKVLREALSYLVETMV